LKNTLFISFLIIFLFAQTSLFGQEIKIVGIVKDTSKTVIPRASIILYDSNENTISYTFSNENGEFIFEFTKKESAYKLSVSSLGYQRKEVPLFINNRKITLEVVLNEKTETLNEIIVSGEKRNDTTKIAIAKYMNQTEQTVEDVLKKLPGVEVLEDGSIKAHGKYISKLLIEGDDILDKNYKLLSKNLDAKF
jgi:hypothetical protein